MAKNFKVLIVEDNPINVIVLKKFIDGICQPEAVTNGEKALEMLENGNYDLVLMDINLGEDEMNGEEVLSRIRAIPHLKTLPVIAVTAYTMDANVKKFKDEGFIDFVPKPINKEVILNIIGKYISTKTP